MDNWQSTDLKTESEAEISERERKNEESGPALKAAGLTENSSDAVARVNTTSTPKNGGDGITGWLQSAGSRVANAFEDMKSIYSFAPKLEEAKSTDDWLAVYRSNATLVTNIGQEVLAKYIYLRDQIADEQITKDTYEGKLGRIYQELNSSVRLLEPFRKVAQKICSQDQTSNEAGSGCKPGDNR